MSCVFDRSLAPSRRQGRGAIRRAFLGVALAILFGVLTPSALNAATQTTAASGPDLVGTIAAPAVGEPGASVAIPITIHNQGTEGAGPFAYRIFAIPLASHELVPTVEVSEGRVAGVEAGATFAASIPITLPSILRGNVYAFELVLDPLEEVAETDRSNNRSRSPTYMVNERPELRITRPAARIQLPEGCFYGERVGVTVELCNSGNGEAVDFRPGILMGEGSLPSASAPIAAASPQACSDPAGPNYDPCGAVGGQTPICAFDFCRLACESDGDCEGPAHHCGDDPHLASFLGVAAAKSCMNRLAAGDAPRVERCQTFELEGMIPAADPGGTPFTRGVQRFHIIEDVLFSTSQPLPDVIASAEFDCRPSLVDLVAASITAPPRMIPGRVAAITRLIRNDGYTNYAPGTMIKNEREHFSYRYYLSTTPNVSKEPIELPVASTGGAGLASIERKGEVLGTDLVEVPPQLRPGEYYLGILLDPEDELEELEEGNNLLVASTKVWIDPSSLQILTASLPPANVDARFTHSLLATRSAWRERWSSEDLPPWLSLSPDGLLAGTPPETGTYAFTVRVDAGVDHALRPLALRVLPGQGGLTITSRALPLAVRGSAYGRWYDPELDAVADGVRLAASGGVPPYRWEAATADLPEGIYGPSEDGWLRGQPTLQARTSTIRLRVRDSLGNPAQAELPLVVVDAGSLVIESRPFALATSGQGYEDCLQVQGGTGSYEWQVEEGSFPPGLHAQPRGDQLCLEGAPTACGNYEVELRVADGEGQRAEARIPFGVECGALHLDTSAVPPVRRGEQVAFKLGVTPSREPSFRLHRGLLPEGLVLDADGAITGTVAMDADLGTHNSILELSDAEGRRSLSALALRVIGDDPPPVGSEGGCASAGTSAVSLPLALLALALLRGRRPGVCRQPSQLGSLSLSFPRRREPSTPPAVGHARPPPSRGRPRRELGWKLSTDSRRAGSAGAPPPAHPAATPVARRLPLVAAVLWVSLLGACGDEDPLPASRCAEVSCTSNMSCDEADGICKCGLLGETCTEEAVCVLDPSPHCVSMACEFVRCERGERCDERSGACTCGDATCDEGSWCVSDVCVPDASCDDVRCAEGLICDPADLLCKCGGAGGVVCGQTERCVQEPAPRCERDPCAGVSCGENSGCDPTDGRCHCGGAGGPLCSAGEACVVAEDAYACAIGAHCADSDCQAGTICDPADGQCRCGGVGPEHPICGTGESCIEGSCKS